MASRFSKSVMIQALSARVDRLKAQYKLDPDNGTAQLRGREQEVAVAYGEFRVCLDLIREIEGGYLRTE